MNNFWRACLACFEKELPPQQYKTWIKPLQFHADGDRVVLVAPNRFVLQWIRDRFLTRIEQLAHEHFKRDVAVQLTLAEKDAVAAPTPQTRPAAPSAAAKPTSREVSRLNPAFSFETFVTGKANELARAAATQDGLMRLMAGVA